MRALPQNFALLALLLAAAYAADLPQLTLAGDATMTAKLLRLTPARERLAGAAWLTTKQQVSTGFETTFQFRLTHQGGGGADGFAFVLQNTGPHAIAGQGASGGFAMGNGRGDPNSPGIPSSIAVFFDTYQNKDAGDPSGNYIAICNAGRPENMAWPPARLAVAPDLAVKMKDHKPHAVHMTYKPPILSIFLDNAHVLSAPVDLSLVADAKGESYAGFTASTGDGYQNHDILAFTFVPGPPKPDISTNISFSEFACLPDRNLCTPDRALVTETAPGAYHVILPANLEWGASLPAESVTIKNIRGTICWDQTHCTTPEATGPASESFLDPTQPPGALITRIKDGRTEFSINTPIARVAEAQGFFEFDVEARH